MSLGDHGHPSPYLFVSYASVDRERVTGIVDVLQASGITVWIDQQDIHGGSRYGTEISDGIRGCAALALMCSEASLASRNVRQEIMLAWKHQRPYIPLLLEQTSFPQEIEYWLEGSQWIEIFDRPDSEWLPRVINALRQIESPVAQRSAPTSFPSPPATMTVATPARNNLPSSSPMVGRAHECQEIKDLVRHGSERLVTLTGPGGTGKSRLSIQVATDLLDDFDEVLFVELAPLAEAELVVPTVAGVLGLREEQQRTFAEQITEYLTAKKVLLVLDNFEHLVDAATDMSRILAASPGLRMLTTSRTRLGIYGEQEYPVPPLQLPDLRRLHSPADLLASEAVALFVQRARMLKPDFALNDSNAVAIAEICVRLDGLPLAIELAAARIKLLTPQAMRARLDKRLPLLTGGARNLPARQQTLRNAIAWSYDLLPIDEQALFRRLCVFAGGWTIEAAEAIVDEQHVSSIDVLDGLTSLVDKSLVRQHEDERGDARFTMLETIREFGLEQLAGTSEVATIEHGHAEYYRNLAEQAESELTGAEQEPWIRRLETEHDNLRAALTWTLEHDAAMATSLAARLGRFWYLRGYLTEGRRWLEATLANDAVESINRASILYHLAGLAMFQGDYHRARPWATEALRLFRDGNHQPGMAMALNVLGVIASREDDLAGANTQLQESLTLYRQVGDDRAAAILIGNLAWLASLQERHDQALAYIEESLVLARRMHDSSGIAYALQNLGLIALERGDIARASDAFVEALTLAREIGTPLDMTECLEGYAAVTAIMGEPKRAAQLFGAAAESRIRINMPVPPTDRPSYDEHLTLARRQLDDVTWTQAWAAGCRLSLDEAVIEALRPISV